MEVAIYEECVVQKNSGSNGRGLILKLSDACSNAENIRGAYRLKFDKVMRSSEAQTSDLNQMFDRTTVTIVV